MADPLSIAASIVALLDLTKEVVRFGKTFYNAKEGREEDITELENLNRLAKVVANRLDEAQRQPTFRWHTVILDELDAKRNGNSPVKRATECADALKNKLRPDHKIRNRDRFLRYWKEKDIESRLAKISGCLKEIDIVLEQGHYQLSKGHYELSKQHFELSEDQYRIQTDMQGQLYALNDTVSRQEQRRLKEDDESLRKAIEQWLSPLEFLARQRDLMSKDFRTRLSWFLESEEFTSWVKGRPWQLRCIGEPGSGKTYLASMVIDHLQKTYQTERSPVLCMFLSEKESENHTPENLLGSMLKQLMQLKRSKPVTRELRDLYENRARGAKPTLREMRDILDAELAGSDRIYVIIDALNECSPKSQRLVEHELTKLYSQNLSLMVTSNEQKGKLAVIICDNCRRTDIRVYFHCHICKSGKFDLCENCARKGVKCQDPSHTVLEPSSVEVEVLATDDEIGSYVRAVIAGEQEDSGGFRDPRVHPNKLGTSRLAQKLAKDQSLLERIPAAVIERADGKFLLAKLYMDSLVTMRTLKEIKNTLDTFPDSWNELYAERMKDRVEGQKNDKDRALALKVLSLATSARRPLTLKELQHALAIEPGEHEFDVDKDFDRDLILEVTKGLLTIDDGDDANSYVRFFHLTLQKYLDETKNRWFSHAELDMATACLTCLQYDDFAERSEPVENVEATLKKNPFTSYALQFWGEHVRNTISVSSIEDLTLKFLKDPGRLAVFIQAAWYSGGQKFSSWDVRRDVDAMHVCAWFGLSSLILKLGLDNNEIDIQEQTYGQTPLIYACRRGHVEAARQLLDLGANANAVSGKGKTPLYEAIEANHSEVVDLLLQRSDLFINVGNSKNHNRTALIIAIQLDLGEMIVAMLKREDIDVNIKDADGYTALSIAALKGSDKIVEALLTKPQIEVNSVDMAGGRTALMLVAEGGHAKGCGIIRVLMGHGANPNLRGHHRGCTALCAAVEEGHIEVVKTLLEFNQTDLFFKDDDGRGLLHYASRSGHADIIRLLKEKTLDLNLQDVTDGFTPLHVAVLENSAAAPIVKLLLDLGADPNIPDNDGSTPFALAHTSWYGQSDVANALKERSNMRDIEETAVEGRPIWTLVKLGSIDRIAEEIAGGKANLNGKEPGTGNGPLHIAVLEGRDDILQVLLDEGKMEINPVNRYNCTPLQLAAGMDGREDALAVLIKRHANLDPLDHLGFTPLSRADKDGAFDVVLTLIEAGATFDPKAINLQGLIFKAADGGRTAAMKIFLDRNMVDPIQRNDQGLTVRQVARGSGDVEMIRLLDPAKSFFYKSPALPSKESSISSLPSMPSPPASFTPFRAFPVDLSEQEDAELEEPLENKFSRLGSLDNI